MLLVVKISLPMLPKNVFIRETLQGVIGEKYADPYGEGRIVIVDSEE